MNWKFVIGVLLSSACCVASALAQTAPRPNIVLIMVDDLGPHELGVTGQLDRAANGLPSIDTPRLDALAAGGLRMNQFYAATPICASTRSSLMTGLHSGHASIDRNGGNNGGNAMRGEEVTVAEVLQAAGYRTGAYGKWGLGGFDHTSGSASFSNPQVTHPDSLPTANGFDEYYGYLNQVRAHDYYQSFQWQHDGNGSVEVDPTSTADYSHDLIAARAEQFVADHAPGDDPFFLYAPYTLPHGSFNPPNDEIRQDYITRGYTNAEANYAAMVTRLDRSVGALVDRVNDPNGDGDTSDSELDSTLFLFASDNGGTSGQEGLFNGNGALRGAKGSVNEGGIRSAFIASWQGTIAPGQVDDDYVASLTDIFATFAELGGADVPVELDSHSFAGRLTGEGATPNHFQIFQHQGPWAIRRGDWKLSRISGSLRLYNLEDDPGENNNLLSNPTPEQQEIANLLQSIALAEGVEMDAGTNAVSTTHIVQYKRWDATGTADWADNDNWTGGSQFNTRGTPANNFASGPANNWSALLQNDDPQPKTAVISASSEVLALEVGSGGGGMTVEVASSANLIARNGARISSGGTVNLDGGSLSTIRTIEVRDGGTLRGSGDIGTVHDLGATVVNHGLIDLVPGEVSTAAEQLVANGGFENGTDVTGDGDYSYQEIDTWTTDGDATFDAAKPNNARSGTFRGLIAVRPDSDDSNHRQDTGHQITLGDSYELVFYHRGFSGWDGGSDSVTATLYYLDDASQRQTIGTTTVLPTVGNWSQATLLVESIDEPDAAGRTLWIDFAPESGNGASGIEFASLDDVQINLLSSTISTTATLAIDGDFHQTASGVLKLSLYTTDGVDASDLLEVSGTAVLDGTLDVDHADSDDIGLGSQFTVLTAADISGTFAITLLPELASGLAWHVDTGATAVTLEAVRATIAGDYNVDGVVDAADYTVWRDLNGSTVVAGALADGNGDGQVTQADYEVWRANFGRSVAQLESSNATVPEPTTVLGAGMLSIAWLITRQVSSYALR